MSYAKNEYKRSKAEVFFIAVFLPTVFLMYSVYKWPHWFVEKGLVDSLDAFWLFGKSPSFWYSTVYTGIVCWISGKILLSDKSPYKRGKNPKLSKYQRNKFLSIFLVQLIIFYLLPYVISPLAAGRSLLSDPVASSYYSAYVYISKGFTSWGSMFYCFVLIPISVWYFGKRYCSWFCACGNLAETIGVTKWGAAWVKHKTPTGKSAERLESIQTLFMIFGFFFGFLLFFDMLKVFTSSNLIEVSRNFESFVVDFIFGAIIGVGAYPFLGTRIWCRYGCPLAKFMELFGRWTKGHFKVKANENCKGVDLCSQACPMGIDVASFAHKDKKPINGDFGLYNTTCIGCGGCVDVCPFDALEFEYKNWA